MIKKISNNVPLYQYELFASQAPKIRHAVYTRATDITDPKAVTTAIQATELQGALCRFDQQLHGDIVWIVREHSEIAEPHTGDAMITKLKKTPLLIRVADCASIMLFDPHKEVIANIHAGWRGLAAHIIKKTVGLMHERFHSNPTDILATISPMLGPCCARFTTPEQELPKHMHPFILEENLVDLPGAAESQLKASGIQDSHIENAHICTACSIEEFHSYRREKLNRGRFGTVIMLV